MIILIGLGNPGEKFNNTRHNVGFMAVDKFAKINNFPDFKLDKKLNALISKNENVLLVKPQTFMNDSGKTAKKIVSSFKFQVSSLIVIHDDIDLPIGKIKIAKERGSAGHKGVESIIESIGNNGLIRFRIGIAGKKDIKAMKIVLKNFSKDEQNIIDQTIQKITSVLDLFIKEGIDKTMNKYNK